MIDELRSKTACRVLGPDDSGYDEARSLWNGDINRRPAVIAQCNTADDVAASLAVARANDLEISVRGGGHNYAGHGVCEGGVMIDLSQMRSVDVDPATRRARAQGGATWADYDAATQEHGLASPGGVISHTGIAGLTLGGGIGWLSHKAGLSCDNLVSAQVVTADGNVVTASASENPDLHWALCGGGGNFGVVTEFEFALHEVGPMVNLGLFFWRADQGAEALQHIRERIAALPDDYGRQVVALNAPPAPFVPEQHQFAPGFVLAVVGWGTPEEHAEVVQPVRELFPPLFDFITPIPYVGLQQMLDESAPWGILAYEKSIYLDELTDAAIATIAERFPKKTSPMSLMPMFPLGGAYRTAAEDDTAFGGSRQSQWLISLDAVAPEPDMLTADRAWVRDTYDAMLKFTPSGAGYINFLVDPDEDRVRAAYGPKKYERLTRIKSKVDPDNVFHLNANIKPASG